MVENALLHSRQYRLFAKGTVELEGKTLSSCSSIWGNIDLVVFIVKLLVSINNTFVFWLPPEVFLVNAMVETNTPPKLFQVNFVKKYLYFW